MKMCRIAYIGVPSEKLSVNIIRKILALLSTLLGTIWISSFTDADNPTSNLNLGSTCCRRLENNNFDKIPEALLLKQGLNIT